MIIENLSMVDVVNIDLIPDVLEMNADRDQFSMRWVFSVDYNSNAGVMNTRTGMTRPIEEELARGMVSAAIARGEKLVKQDREDGGRVIYFNG